MKTVRDVMSPSAVWINPRHTVKTAALIMRGYGLSGLPVLDGDELVGFIESADIVGESPDRIISDLMRIDLPIVSPDDPLRHIAEIMTNGNYHQLPILEDDYLVGIVTSTALLLELGKSYDPLTELPWSDTLREWAMEALSNGQEITVIFYDLDDFGEFNKKYGHLVGDQVLQRAAKVLSDNTVAGKDCLCRYGGDEFAIATVRRKDEAGLIAGKIAKKIESIRIPGVDKPVTASYGYYGGRRSKLRSQIHYAATIESLINLASRECMAMKAYNQADEKNREEPQIEPEPELPTIRRIRDGLKSTAEAVAQPTTQADHTHAIVEPNIQPNKESESIQSTPEPTTVKPKLIQPPKLWAFLHDVSYVVEGDLANVDVRIAIGGRNYTGSLAGPARQENALELVAQATANTLLRALPDNNNIIIREVAYTAGGDGNDLITVKATVIVPTGNTEVIGSVLAGDDPYRATASAVLSAVEAPLSSG